VLRTIRSRCSRLELAPLTAEDARKVVAGLIAGEPVEPEALEMALRNAHGSPGLAMDLLNSEGAKAFAAFEGLPALAPAQLIEFGNRFSGRSMSAADFDIFCELLQNWVGTRAREQGLSARGHPMASAYKAIGQSIRETNALNLDRRHTVIQALTQIDKALRAG
jgi:DNA polymerase III subunit delta'